MHSDGSIMPLLPSIAEAGIDILNPIQWTARNMDPQTLKDRFGGQFIFWGGGVNTQGTLPFGAPEQVREEVERNLRIFGQGSGYVFTSVHNIQPGVPAENLLAFYEAYREHRDYLLKNQFGY